MNKLSYNLLFMGAFWGGFVFTVFGSETLSPAQMKKIELWQGQLLKEALDCRGLDKINTPLIAELQESVEYYTGKGFYELNKGLLGEQNPVPRRLSSRENENWIHLKNICYFLSKSPKKYSGMVYRGMALDPVDSSKLVESTLKNQSIFLSRGFSSTTVDLSVAFKFTNGWLGIFKANWYGKDISENAEIKEEREILFPAHTEFLIEKMRVFLPKDPAQRELVVFLGQEIVQFSLAVSAKTEEEAQLVALHQCFKSPANKELSRCFAGCHAQAPGTNVPNWACSFYRWQPQGTNILGSDEVQQVRAFKKQYTGRELDCAQWELSKSAEPANSLVEAVPINKENRWCPQILKIDENEKQRLSK